jgi:ParB family transcriptional regulator, chromosome partitioning protein
MTTINTSRNKSKMNKTETENTPNTLLLRDADFAQINVKEIRFSPLNYRKYFSEEALQEFADELKQHGMISPVTVRVSDSNGYELVAGERRIRAAQIAGLETVPAAIVSLTDEQVTEIQLAENLQRENPHPMDEANAIKRMQDVNHSLEDIALRLGKSKKFVYIRLKLLNLIEPIREMFYANSITLQQALEIATISQEGQQQFFDEHCKNWQRKTFRLHDLDWYLRHYKYDLKEAPFNTKDKTLIAEVGACTGCPFNSATVKSLFPELAKQAVCSNTSCYQKKCDAAIRIAFLKALEVHQPTALLAYGEPSDLLKRFREEIPEAADLKLYDYSQITIIVAPEEPQSEDYTDDDDDGEPIFHAEAYEEAQKEYEAELAEYKDDVASGFYQKGLMERREEFALVMFNTQPRIRSNFETGGSKVSMKTVQDALKAGTATHEMLQEAIQAVLQKEERAKEIDRDKVQQEVHRLFQERFSIVENNENYTNADWVALRLLVYQSFDYSTRSEVDKVLFANTDEDEENTIESFYLRLQALTGQQFSYMIRKSLACKTDSKYPTSQAGYTLYKLAEEAGVNVAAVEYEQEEKADARKERMQTKINELEKKSKKLKKSA